MYGRVKSQLYLISMKCEMGASAIDNDDNVSSTIFTRVCQMSTKYVYCANTISTIYIACVYACACKLWVIVWKFRIPDTKMNKRKMQCFLPTYQQIFTNKIFHLFFFFSHENSFFYLFCPLNKYWNLLAHFTQK